MINTAISDKDLEMLKLLRRELHNNPEPSGAEEKTIAIIEKFLREKTELKVFRYSGGICALYRATEVKKPLIAFRADFDAVPLPEGGAAHICGHDGHTAALLGVAIMLERIKPQRDVLLLFQPAEECGFGAEEMLPVLEEYGVSEIFGCHNLPGFEFGRVYTRRKTFACASSGMSFGFFGKPTHAAYPENGISPAKAVAEFLGIAVDILENKPFGELTFATVIGCNMGQKAFGTSAEKAEVWLTVRSDSNESFMKIRDYLTKRAEALSNEGGLRLEISEQDVFPATENDPESADHIVSRTGGELLSEPMRWSEDFGHYLMKCRGAFFGIGAGSCEPLHTEKYEYPDELLKPQIEAFLKLL